jgi:hypothetical protein
MSGKLGMVGKGDPCRNPVLVNESDRLILCEKGWRGTGARWLRSSWGWGVMRGASAACT